MRHICTQGFKKMSIVQLFTIIARLKEDVESHHLKVLMAINREGTFVTFVALVALVAVVAASRKM
jgi:hypothetical protein